MYISVWNREWFSPNNTVIYGLQPEIRMGAAVWIANETTSTPELWYFSGNTSEIGM